MCQVVSDASTKTTRDSEIEKFITGPGAGTWNALEGPHREVKAQTESGQQDLGHAFTRAMSGVLLGLPG